MRICKKCGNEISDFNAACPHCGNTVELEEIAEEYGNEIYNPKVEEFIPKSLTKLIVFSILTFGIYFFVYMEKFRKDVNRLCKGDYRYSAHFLWVAFLSIVTFGIYYLYWIGTQADRINQKSKALAINCRESVAVPIFLTVVFPIVGFLGAIYLIFDNFNRVVAVVDGHQSASAINKRPGHGLFIGIVIIVGFVWNVGLITGLDMWLDHQYGFGNNLNIADLTKDEPVDKLIEKGAHQGIDYNDDDSFAYGYYDGTAEGSRPAGSTKYAVNLINETDMNFTGITVSLSGKNQWHDVIFDKGFVLRKGESMTIPVYVIADSPDLDIVLIDEDKDLHTLKNVNLTKMSTFSPTMKVTGSSEDFSYILKDAKE